MNSIIAIALGGAAGAVLRFLISTGVYQWLGRSFPYGTLTVNILGSFLIGLLTEALVLQRMALTNEYRSAILVGLFGSLTTFSTFSLETIYLIEQGHFAKTLLNILLNVCVCLLVVWLGLLLGRALFTHADGMLHWMGWVFPYAVLAVNAFGAFLIGLISVILVNKSALSDEYRAVILILPIGIFLTLSSLYVLLYLVEEGQQIKQELNGMLVVVLVNTLLCGSAIWSGVLLGRQV